MELLRLRHAGSVDDGKSTLIGRLLLRHRSRSSRTSSRRSSAPAATAATST